MSLDLHLQSFAGKFDEELPMNKKLDFTDVDTIFIYLTGHGGDKYMKVKYKEILFSKHFSDFIEDLFISKKVKQAFVISDTCSAGTSILHNK